MSLSPLVALVTERKSFISLAVIEVLIVVPMIALLVGNLLRKLIFR